MTSSTSKIINHYNVINHKLYYMPKPSNNKTIFKRVANYRSLYIYQKAEVLVIITDIFCKRFLPRYGDRTVDQMNQAARSGKQNIVEGSEAAMTSSETEVKLVNVGRASFQELREDYEDYLNKNNLPIWDSSHPRYDKMLAYCRTNNHVDAYRPFAQKCTAEEFCNMALTLCHITDKMFASYLKQLEQRFVEEGGVKERMSDARTGYRQEMKNRMRELETENRRLKAENETLKKQLEGLKNH